MAEEYYLRGLTSLDNVKYKLTPVAWKKLESSKLLTDNIFSIEQKYDLMISNYYNFEKELLLQTLEDSLRVNDLTTFQFVNLASIIRESQNLIISISLFYEQTSNRHLNKLPVSNDKLIKIVQHLNKIKNDNVEIDFIISLRNYIAHRDIPIDSFVIGSDWDFNNEISERKLGRSIIPYISKLRLINDKKFKRSCLTKLHSKDKDRIDFRYPVNRTISLLSSFMDNFRKELKNELIDANNIVNNFIKDFKSFSKSTNDFCEALYEDSKGINKTYYLSNEIFNHIEFYSKRNLYLNLLEKQYVHNKI